MDVMAQRIGKTLFQTETLLRKAIDEELIKGVIDRSADEFVIQEMIGRQIFVERCPHCGARINRWFLPEDRLVCPYCDQAILASTVGAPPRPPP